MTFLHSQKDFSCLENVFCVTQMCFSVPGNFLFWKYVEPTDFLKENNYILSLALLKKHVRVVIMWIGNVSKWCPDVYQMRMKWSTRVLSLTEILIWKRRGMRRFKGWMYAFVHIITNPQGLKTLLFLKFKTLTGLYVQDVYH